MSASAADQLDAAEDTPADDGSLARHGERIDRLLDEIQALAGPTTWPRVEELVKALVHLYGAGLARLLAHARATALDEPALERQLTNDTVLAGLLTLHDLHPLTVEQRVEQALERLERDLQLLPNQLELVHVESDGVRLRLHDVDDPLAAKSLVQLVQRALVHAAPELERVDISTSATHRAGQHELPALDAPLVSPERLLQGRRA